MSLEDPVRRYRIGTTPDSPFHVITLAGITFPRTSEIVRIDEDTGATRRSEQRGVVVDLDEARIEAVRKAAATRRVRVMRAPNGEATRVSMFVVGSRRYRPQQDDARIEKYLYIEPTEEDPYTQEPKVRTLADEAEAAAGASPSPKSTGVQKSR